MRKDFEAFRTDKDVLGMNIFESAEVKKNWIMTMLSFISILKLLQQFAIREYEILIIQRAELY